MRTGMIGGLRVSAIGLGCNNFGRALDREASVEVVHAALEQGVTYFDTARNYGHGQSESFLAAGLGDRRDEVVIATKFGRIPHGSGGGGATRDDVRRAIHQSLGELRTDYVDLYQLHFPDPDTPIEETLGALNELREEGKVREIGCCNHDASQLNRALAVSTEEGWGRFVSNQVHYSMVHREPELDGVAAYCATNKVGLLPYYPLASGFLTGKTRRGEEPAGRLRLERYQHFLTGDGFDLLERLEPYAGARGLTVAQVALGWLLSRPAVPAVTPGATRPEQVGSNVAAGSWQPSREDLATLDTLIDPRFSTPG